MKHLKYHFLSLLVTLLVAGSFLSSAKLSGVINPFSLTLLRFIIAAVVLIPFIMMKKNYKAQVAKALPRSMIMSLFFSIFFICMFTTLKTTSALNTGSLYTLVPFITAIFSLFIFRDKIAKKMFFVYLLGSAGTCWVIFSGDINALVAFSLNSGDAIFLAGCISMVLFSISMKLLYRGDDMLVVVFCTLLGGAFWMLLALTLFNKPFDWGKLDGSLMLHMGYLAIFATLASTFIIQKTTVVLGPVKVMGYLYLNPLCVAILMWLMEGKSIPTIVLPGMLLSILATLLLQLQKSSITPLNVSD